MNDDPNESRAEMKLLTPLTMENIADSLVAESLASKEEVGSLASKLYEYRRWIL
jgi:hypothetical protein